MKCLKLLIILLTILIVSCKEKDVTFNYTFMKSDSSILIENYYPVTRQQLTKYLTKINDTLKLKDLRVLLKAENVQLINPEFKQNYYRGYIGKMGLSSVQSDTLRDMRRTNFVFGTFKNKTFVKNDNWDSLLLKNRFFKSTD